MPDCDPITKSLRSKEEAIQLAFLRTFPNNLCSLPAAGEEFPYFMMVKSRELMKIHGSSVMSGSGKKPKWVCCQNLVISSITNRPMTKFIVPISEKVLDMMDRTFQAMHKKATENSKTDCIFNNFQPTAFLRYLRNKNHNEIIITKLTENQAYLETDEDKERIIYFYIDNKKEKIPDNKSKFQLIKEMTKDIQKDIESSAEKRHYTSPVSDKSKMNIDVNGRCVDMLDATEFLSFLVKSSSNEIFKHILEQAKLMNFRSTDIHIAKKKASNIMIVSLKDKIAAKVIFEMSRDFIENVRKVQGRQRINSLSNLWSQHARRRREIPKVENGDPVV